jgi:hypothetical protein
LLPVTIEEVRGGGWPDGGRWGGCWPDGGRWWDGWPDGGRWWGGTGIELEDGMVEEEGRGRR